MAVFTQLIVSTWVNLRGMVAAALHGAARVGGMGCDGQGSTALYVMLGCFAGGVAQACCAGVQLHAGQLQRLRWVLAQAMDERFSSNAARVGLGAPRQWW